MLTWIDKFKLTKQTRRNRLSRLNAGEGVDIVEVTLGFEGLQSVLITLNEFIY